jgi:membrane-bound lytic murein transglycosylase A
MWGKIIGLGLTATLLTLLPVGATPLKRLSDMPIPLDFGKDDQIWQSPTGQKGDLVNLLRSVDQSLRYLQTDAAAKAYSKYPISDFSRDRVERSLRRFRVLVRTAKTPGALAKAVQQEFAIYQSVGKDQQGKVEFTGYYEATYKASLTPSSRYRYPLYRLPPTFSSWSPQPTRQQLEGVDGLQGSKGKLRGMELVWLSDRLEAYLTQIQGSARLTLTNGKTMTVGFAGKTNYPYTSLGKELIKDGKLSQENLSLPKVLKYFQDNPLELNTYIPRNKSFVFFKETYGAQATGSLGVPVTAERSIATDKSMMPPGALALVQTKIPYLKAPQQIEQIAVNRFVLDQDTGSAIKGPGRVDIFMGTGTVAKQRSGLMNTPGQLYYLLLKK